MGSPHCWWETMKSIIFYSCSQRRALFIYCKLSSRNSIVFHVMLHHPPCGHTPWWARFLHYYFTPFHWCVWFHTKWAHWGFLVPTLRIVISSAAISSMKLRMFWKSHLWRTLAAADPKRGNAEALLHHGLEVWQQGRTVGLLDRSQPSCVRNWAKCLWPPHGSLQAMFLEKVFC